MAHARALVPDVVTEPHRPRRELEALGALARWALRFSPIVATDPPDGLLVDISGCQRLFGGEQRLLQMIAVAVGRLGFQTRVAAAPTFACAWAVARFGSDQRAVVPEGGQRAAMSALPVEALRVEQAVAEALREVGIEQIGHLLDLPRPSLASRFGSGLLSRLDQAMGKATETIDPVRPVTPAMAERLFAGPVKNQDAIELTVRELLGELSQVLAQRECGARRVDLCLDRLDAEPLSVTIALSRPSRDAGHLWSLLRPRVESVNLGWGVERVRLVAERLGRLDHEQAEVWVATSGRRCLDRDLGELIDTLSNRLGSQRVACVEPVEAHLPERAFRLRPAAEPGVPSPGENASVCPDRPSLLLERPEPITVIAMTPEGPPLWFRWRGHEQRITASAGPERIATEWWRGNGEERHGEERHGGTKARRHEGRRESYARAYGRFLLGREYHPDAEGARSEPSCLRASVPSCLLTRDYFKVQDEHGRWLWIYRVLEGNDWFVHGLWA